MKLKTNSFVVWDYVVFFGTLVISMGIGIFFAVKGRKSKSEGEYLVGSRGMSVIPVSVSIMVSYLSAISILGNPAEIYTQGGAFVLTVFGMVIGCLLSALVFVPLIYPLQLTSVYEYLERRYNSKAVRMVGTWIMILSQVIYMGTATYAPSTALEAVTGFPVWATIVITVAAGTFYTCVGGMKAVVWTDVFQCAVMVAGVLAVIIQATIKVGSATRVWDISDEWGRLDFFNFDPDPRVRNSFWPLVLGGMLNWMGTFGLAQPSVQRYSSLPTFRKAQLSTMLLSVGGPSIVLFCCIAGFCVFAYYVTQDCDPLGKGLVDNPNQLVPFFVMETLSYPCIPGLFISSLFSGALSSLSSALNSLAAVTWEDMLKPVLKTKLGDAKRLAVIQGLVLFYGILALIMGFVVQNLEGTVLQVTISLLGASSGPANGIFLLGAFFPWANAKGAIVGSLVSLVFCCWIAIGAYVTGIPRDSFPFPNGTCSAYFENETISAMTSTFSPVTTTLLTTSTDLITTSSPVVSDGSSGIEELYKISYLWYSPIGMGITIVVGLIISFITGANSMHDVPTKYQVPLATRLACCLPLSWQRSLNCKRDFDEPELVLSQETDFDTEIVIPDPVNGKMKFDNLAFTPDAADSDLPDKQVSKEDASINNHSAEMSRM